jgi:carbonic anhydrase/acetyltransferase-like protein (isoleucine patch superfamily)
MREKKLLFYRELFPKVHESVFLAEGAYVIGNVSIGLYSNIWFNCVIRGDVQYIRIGEYTNIQDNCIIHVTNDQPTIVEDYVTVGHGAILHGCHVANNCLIGMGAILLGHSEVGENCIIAAGTLIPERKKIPANSLVMGSPGKVIRTITPEEIVAIRESALRYQEEAELYLQQQTK